MDKTKICKYCQSEISKKAKICPNCRKKQGSIGKTLAIVIAIFLIVGVASSGSESEKGTDENPKKVTNSASDSASESSETNATEQKNEFAVGDVIETSNMKISFLSASEHNPNNEFLQPQEGYVFWRFEFEFENISNSDQTVSSMIDWGCYADDYDMKQTWIGDDSLDATISSGKKAKGSIYFELPKEFSTATLEYKTNYWTGNKVIFKIR